MSARYLAFDLGASSGRAILGSLGRDDQLTLRELHRFPNAMVDVLGNLHWDLLGLYREMLHALASCAKTPAGPPTSVGIDTWGLDFGLLDRDGRLLGNPRTYRDPGNAGAMKAFFEEHLPPEPALYNEYHALIVELGKQVKDTTVSTSHVAKPPILPQLIAVPDLDIRKPVSKVVVESVEKELLVLGKGIRPAIVPAMTVAKEYDPRGIIKRHPLGGLKYLCQPSVCSYARLVPERARTPSRQCPPRRKTCYHAWLISPFELVFPFYHLLHTAWVNLS